MTQRAAEKYTPERRSVPRAPTSREVLFGPLDGSVPSLEGVVINISPEGAGIRTASPLMPDTPVFLEIHPKPGATEKDSVLVRGYVVRQQSCGSGEYIIGMRMRLAPPATGKTPASPFHNAAEAEEAIARAITAVQALKTARPFPISVFEEHPVHATPPRKPPKKKRRRGLLLLLLLLCLALALLFLGKDPPLLARGVKSLPTGSSNEASLAGNELVLALTGRDELVDLAKGKSRPRSPRTRGGVTTPRNGLPGKPRPGARGSEDGRSRPPLDGFVVATLAGVRGNEEDPADVPALTIEIAENLSGDGRPSGGDALFEGGASFQPAVPDSAVDSSAASRSPLQKQGNPGQDPEDPFESVVPITDPARIQLQIDKSDYALTVLVDGQPAHTFPIGLGKGNSTPEGDFTIANKVLHPDWHHKGRVVKADDPENPLGESWMGLGRGGRPTHYGIHPTKEPESIGANQSRGCVRMRPGDARALFRICPVGASVTIQP